MGETQPDSPDLPRPAQLPRGDGSHHLPIPGGDRSTGPQPLPGERLGPHTLHFIASCDTGGEQRWGLCAGPSPTPHNCPSPTPHTCPSPTPHPHLKPILLPHWRVNPGSSLCRTPPQPCPAASVQAVRHCPGVQDSCAGAGLWSASPASHRQPGPASNLECGLCGTWNTFWAEAQVLSSPSRPTIRRNQSPLPPQAASSQACRVGGC